MKARARLYGMTDFDRSYDHGSLWGSVGGFSVNPDCAVFWVLPLLGPL